MKILLWGTAIFSAAFLIHLIYWKISLPKRQTKTLLFIFFGTLFISLAILALAALSNQAAHYVPQQPGEYISIILFCVSLTLAYIITYSAMEADSPTLVMIMSIAAKKEQGLDKKEFDGQMTDEVLVIPRINDLVRDKLAKIRDKKYRLTPKGESFISIFIFYRKLLKNVNQKGG